MSETDKLPTIGEIISDWLGVKLPALPMRQTAKNLDKALSKIVRAVGENVEARIKTNTAKTKARGKIDVEGMYWTEDEKRKIENRVATTQAALEDLRHTPPDDDAQAEIDDDWLNYFARIAEDKSSEELQNLFGKILSGEIKRPGSFSLRTIQTLATISMNDADTLSKLLSFAVGAAVVPFETAPNGQPTAAERVFLDELGVAGHPNQIGGMALTINIGAKSHALVSAVGDHSILIANDMSEPASFSIPGQLLTNTGKELLTIANSPPTDFEFLKTVASRIRGDLMSRYAREMTGGLLKAQMVSSKAEGAQTRLTVLLTIE